MENIMDLQTYKEHLIDFYRWPVDANKRVIREQAIARIDDSRFQKILENTEEFALYLLEKMKEENSVYQDTIYISFTTSEEKWIDNQCGGGFPADVLYPVVEFGEDYFVSKYLLTTFLENFRIWYDNDVIEEYDEREDVGGFRPNYQLSVSTTLANFQEIYEKYLKQEKKLVKKQNVEK